MAVSQRSEPRSSPKAPLSSSRFTNLSHLFNNSSFLPSDSLHPEFFNITRSRQYSYYSGILKQVHSSGLKCYLFLAFLDKILTQCLVRGWYTINVCERMGKKTDLSSSSMQSASLNSQPSLLLLTSFYFVSLVIYPHVLLPHPEHNTQRAGVLLGPYAIPHSTQHRLGALARVGDKGSRDPSSSYNMDISSLKRHFTYLISILSLEKWRLN